MPELGAARVDDITWGQGDHTWSPVPALKGSPNVQVNGKEAMRVGDPFGKHYFMIDGILAPPVDPHDSVAAQGSQTVFVNGLAMARGPSHGPAEGGDQVSCSDTIAVGSSNVIVGG